MRCLPNPHKEKCNQPYVPVNLLDSQLAALYERLQPPKKLLELLKAEMEEIAWRRKRIALKELKALKRTVEDLENKEMKLLDEMLGGKTPRDIYEKMERKYAGQRREAEARLSQLEVDYDDPLDFLDKCIVVASMLSYLHQRFDYEQRKNLLSTVFERIYIQNRAIVDVKLNPPFSFLLKRDIEKVFKNHPTEGTKVALWRKLSPQAFTYLSR